MFTQRVFTKLVLNLIYIHQHSKHQRLIDRKLANWLRSISLYFDTGQVKSSIHFTNRLKRTRRTSNYIFGGEGPNSLLDSSSSTITTTNRLIYNRKKHFKYENSYFIRSRLIITIRLDQFECDVNIPSVQKTS